MNIRILNIKNEPLVSTKINQFLYGCLFKIIQTDQTYLKAEMTSRPQRITKTFRNKYVTIEVTFITSNLKLRLVKDVICRAA